MKERYGKMLEKTYELEGLLLLAVNRDEMPEGLEAMIERRLTELVETGKMKDADPQVAMNQNTVEQEHEEPEFYALEDEEEDSPTMGSNKKNRLDSKKKCLLFRLMTDFFSSENCLEATLLNSIRHSISFLQ